MSRTEPNGLKEACLKCKLINENVLYFNSVGNVETNVLIYK